MSSDEEFPPRLSYEVIIAATRCLPLEIRIAMREEDLEKIDLVIHKVDSIFHGTQGAPHKLTKELKQIYQEAQYVRQLCRLDQPKKAKETRSLPSLEEIYAEMLSPESLSAAAKQDEDAGKLLTMTR